MGINFIGNNENELVLTIFYSPGVICQRSEETSAKKQ